ncbi:MAG: hypothetical protein U0805_08570 [Pirellulales bacterium]
MSIGSVWNSNTFPGKAAVAVAAICSLAVARDIPNRSDEPANAATRAVSDEARRILASIKKTEYKHKTDIDEAKGQYYCDCSGFVGYVLNRTVAKDDPKGPLLDGDRRPVAAKFEKAFESAPETAEGADRWQRVARLVDARPGDVIAWRHAVAKPGNTGHVVIVDARPVEEEGGLVRVVVIDSTTKPQVDDTRAAGTSGIGRGTMWFKVDAQGRPVAYVRGSRKARANEEPIAIGRAIPTAEKPAKRKAA